MRLFSQPFSRILEHTLLNIRQYTYLYGLGFQLQNTFCFSRNKWKTLIFYAVPYFLEGCRKLGVDDVLLTGSVSQFFFLLQLQLQAVTKMLLRLKNTHIHYLMINSYALKMCLFFFLIYIWLISAGIQVSSVVHFMYKILECLLCPPSKHPILISDTFCQLFYMENDFFFFSKTAHQNFILEYL